DGCSGRTNRTGQFAADARPEELFETRLSREPVPVCRISRVGGERGRAGGNLRRDRRGEWRRPVYMDQPGRGARQIVEGPPPGLLGVTHASAGREGTFDRRMRADFAAR